MATILYEVKTYQTKIQRYYLKGEKLLCHYLQQITKI